MLDALKDTTSYNLLPSGKFNTGKYASLYWFCVLSSAHKDTTYKGSGTEGFLPVVPVGPPEPGGPPIGPAGPL